MRASAQTNFGGAHGCQRNVDSRLRTRGCLAQSMLRTAPWPFISRNCQGVPQRELARKSWSLITSYFYLFSLEYSQALSSSI
jgi:hypothetical protein